jgi:hypothetical protein
MPIKRVAAAIGNQSPPPAQRPALAQEHHFSPIRGHQPDIPDDAAVALTSPPRIQQNHNAANETDTVRCIDDDRASASEPTTIPPEDPDQQSRTPQSSATAVATTVPALASSVVANGGARAAFAASQQQRSATCNLSTIPASKCKW